VLVKPSDQTPHTAALMQSSIADAIDPAVVAVVCGDAGVAASLTRLPFDILLFTGSHRVGQMVMAAAADRPTPVILELGGKSPVIVDRSADLGRSARSIMGGKLVNAGQTCVAPDYVLVPRESYDAFLGQLQAAAMRLYPVPTSGDYSAILAEDAIARLRRLEADHTTIDLFAQRLDPPYYGPKLVLAPAADSAIMREEIFGPLLPVIPYDAIEDALAVIRKLPPALVLYWFGEANARLEHTVQATSSGAVSINETVIHAGISALPFGGIGASGVGRYHGRAGFDAFTHERPVFRQSRFSVTGLMRPPYGSMADRILKQLLR
jgi:coniferyl-aldehyde dehydrogenase